MRLLVREVLTFRPVKTLLTGLAQVRKGAMEPATAALSESAAPRIGIPVKMMPGSLPGAEAAALVADNQGGALSRAQPAQIRALGCQPHHRAAGGVRRGCAKSGGAGDRERQPENRAHRAAHDLGMIGIDAEAPEDHPRGAEGLGRAQAAFRRCPDR